MIANCSMCSAGKSSLIRVLLPACTVPEQRQVVQPQEVDADRGRAVLDRARALPKSRLGQLMTIVSRLGSRPQRLLESRVPEILVLDEPTNHLDLPSIEALQQALVDCPCAMLIVTHDRRLIEALSLQEWRLESVAVDSFALARR